MDRQCYKQMTKTVNNWTAADVRIVPGVMCQIRCGPAENDSSVEYQINWFMDCTETYIHNHGHSFDTFCLEGEYEETLWDICDDGTNAITYQFHRKPGNIFDMPKEITGGLRSVGSRHHFPGNVMHVDTNQHHSILPIAGSNCRVLTFLAKRTHSPTPNVYVLSESPNISAPKEEIRPATEVERQKIYSKLQQVLKTRFEY